MQLLAILAAAVLVLAVIVLAGRSGLLERPTAPWRRSPARRSPARQPAPADVRDSEFAEELAPQMTPSREPSVYEPEYAVPSRYGDNAVVLMVRDPEWLYAYWEVQPEEVQHEAQRRGVDLSGSSPVLRLYDVTAAPDGRGAPFRDIVLTEYADRWYVSAMTPSHEYYAEIGRITRSGRFIAFARSNRVMTPPVGVSTITSPEWPPLEWPGAGYAGGVSSPEFLGKVARR
ncbi:MAG: DUF4912 domain-containing protein [Ignavibacteriales bacterium]